MKKLINSLRRLVHAVRKKRIQKVIETSSYSHFRQKFMDPSFDWKKYKNTENEYFKKWGFKVSNMEAEYFSICSGVKSDLYLPFSIWKYYIYSYLNKDPWRYAYSDKNMFHRLLDINNKSSFIKLPEVITYNMSGIYYNSEHNVITQDECVELILQYPEDLIIKPTVDSHGGSGILKLNHQKLSNQYVKDIVTKYEQNFVVQRIIKQHSDLASFNKSSINTIRVATYLKPSDEVKVLYAVQRFGGGDDVFDNASSGGGYCGVLLDGTYMRIFHKHKHIQTYTLPDSVAKKVPFFEKIKQVVCELHLKLPQFGIIGWDVTVGADDQLYLIEYNFSLGYNLPQSSLGPIFSKDDLDEIMELVSTAQLRMKKGYRLVHDEKPSYYFDF